MLMFVAGFGIWAAVHSLTAARGVKRWVRERVGQRAHDGFYRLAYNALSVVSIAPLLYVLATRVPGAVVWRVRQPWSVLFVALQVVGLAGLALSLWQTDIWRFVGLRQVWRYLQGEQEPDPPADFVRTGTYGLVRHPLYFFSMMVIWFMPVMAVRTMVFNVLATLYFLIGSLHEERRLEGEFGEAYRRYREEVGGFWPRLGGGD